MRLAIAVVELECRKWVVGLDEVVDDAEESTVVEGPSFASPLPLALVAALSWGIMAGEPGEGGDGGSELFLDDTGELRADSVMLLNLDSLEVFDLIVPLDLEMGALFVLLLLLMVGDTLES